MKNIIYIVLLCGALAIISTLSNFGDEVALLEGKLEDMNNRIYGLEQTIYDLEQTIEEFQKGTPKRYTSSVVAHIARVTG